MALPTSGSISGLYQYTLGVDTDVNGVADINTLTLDQSNVTATFGTDGFGNPTITVGTDAPQQLTSIGDAQSATAFTYVSGGTTYVLSNGQIQLTQVAATVGNLTVLVGLLGASGGPVTGDEDYVACYLAGTMILTDRGEIAVESLSIGDMLVTISGALRAIKWIGTRSYDMTGVQAGKSGVLPICIKRGALADNIPCRDLYVSPRHALFIDGSLFPAGLLVNGNTIRALQVIDAIHYFHVELDSHDVILAEGAASETFVDDNSRAMFQNTPDYGALYPNEARVQATYFAPRMTSGYRLEALVQQLTARGQLLQADGRAVVLGPLRGSFDQLTASTILGWALDTHAPECPVDLVILDNDVVIGEVCAEIYRSDLQAAAIGDGCHGFSVTIPAQLSGFSRHVISVRRQADGTELPGSPMVLEATMASTYRVAA
jgi:hypothetical protein